MTSLPPLLVVQDRQRERHLVEAVDDLADDVGALVAEEQRRQHLDLEVGAQLDLVQARAHGLEHVARVALQVLERPLQLEVVDDAHDRVAQRLARRVVGAVGRHRRRLVVLDVLGADRRPHEDEVVVEIGAVQDLGGDRIEEGLGQLGLVVVDQQADVVQLDLLPHLHRLLAGLEFLLQPARGFLHPQVVELDALALGALLAVPVGGLEAVLGPRRLGAEQAVVPVEAVHHRLGDVIGERRIEALREQRHAMSFSGGRRSRLPPPRGTRARSSRCWPPSCCRSCSRPSLHAESPAVNADLLAAGPGIDHHRADADVDHLLDHVQVAQRVGTRCFRQALQQPRWRSRTSWMCRIQLSARPMRAPSSAACTPPQP